LKKIVKERLINARELFREEKLPDGTRMRKWAPVVYGYSMTIGPDGKNM